MNKAVRLDDIFLRFPKFYNINKHFIYDFGIQRFRLISSNLRSTTDGV